MNAEALIFIRNKTDEHLYLYNGNPTFSNKKKGMVTNVIDKQKDIT